METGRAMAADGPQRHFFSLFLSSFFSVPRRRRRRRRRRRKETCEIILKLFIPALIPARQEMEFDSVEYKELCLISYLFFLEIRAGISEAPAHIRCVSVSLFYSVGVCLWLLRWRVANIEQRRARRPPLLIFLYLMSLQYKKIALE
jgi:hypothetical protein